MEPAQVANFSDRVYATVAPFFPVDLGQWPDWSHVTLREAAQRSYPARNVVVPAAPAPKKRRISRKCVKKIWPQVRSALHPVLLHYRADGYLHSAIRAVPSGM